ncbi:MAG: helix-turn-helix domain-containing protein [Acidimicrobiales bacterium]
MATALDLVGDRWTLLIIRDLLVSDRRFSQLRSELVGISPTLLSTRLRDLIADGLVTQTGNRYSLTERGRGLHEVISALGRWGVPAMDVPKRTDHLSADYRITGLYSLVQTSRITGPPLSAAVMVDGELVTLRTVDDGVTRRVVIDDEPSVDADVTVVATMLGLISLHTGRSSAEDAQRAALFASMVSRRRGLFPQPHFAGGTLVSWAERWQSGRLRRS